MQDLSHFTIKGIACPLIFVPPGSLRLGEYEQSKVFYFKEGFYMGKYPVLQALWTAVMGENPSYFKGENHPVETVSWDAICEEGGFLDRLNQCSEAKALRQADGKQFRLPSESQWEYAARGGAASLGFPYAGSHRLAEVAWYEDNSYGETHPVGLKAPSELGLHDMSGNVREWCADQYHSDYNNAPEDGSAWIDDAKDNGTRVLRGGSWSGISRNCRSSLRHYYYPDLRSGNGGFRLVRA